MSTQESSPPRGRTRIAVGVLAALLVVVVVLAVLVLTGVTQALFAKDITRTVRNDVDASGLVAVLVSYPDSFRGSTVAAGRVDLEVQIDQAALISADPTALPATVVVRNFSCPGADSAAAGARFVIDGADAAHVQARPGGVALTGAFDIVSVTPTQPGAVPECRIDLAAR